MNQDEYSSIMDIEQNFVRLRITYLVLNLVRSFCFILSSVFLILEKERIEHEFNNSPLKFIDENLNEEMYKSIICVSKDPENHEERHRFTSLSRQKASLKQGESNLFSNNSKLVTSKIIIKLKRTVIKFRLRFS
jgi:hypothetical protein